MKNRKNINLLIEWIKMKHGNEDRTSEEVQNKYKRNIDFQMYLLHEKNIPASEIIDMGNDLNEEENKPNRNEPE